MEAGRVEVKQVMDWYRAGWALFKKNPTVWLLFTLIWLVLGVALWEVPLIGPVAWWVLTPTLYGGYLIAARELEQGRLPAVRNLFQGLLDGEKRTALITIGVVTLAAYITLFLSLTLESQMGVGPTDPSHVMSLAEWLNVFLRILLVTIVVGLAGMGIIYASPLILFTSLEGIEALMTSFETCWDNWRVLLAFAAVFAALALGSVLTLGLGLFVAIPVTYCAAYQSYKTLFA
jgi:uncharacterized membrane protein